MTKLDIEEIFDRGGELERKLPGYEYREGQLLMAEIVRQAFENDALAAVEAGTGIGKSFAYLAVALFFMMQNPDEKTIVATSTINLQKQLFEKDLPMLLDCLNYSCKTALAVGRSNYVCLLRFMQVRGESGLLAQDPENELHQVHQWLKQTESGLFADYPYRLSGDLRSEICCDPDLCPSYSCAYIKECYFFKAKTKAKEAKIVISNHHLLFTDAQSRRISEVDYDEEMVLPAFNRLVIDEAHNIEPNATEYFTDIYDVRDMLRQINRIQRGGRHGGSSLLEQLKPYATEALLVERIYDDITYLLQDIQTLDEYLVTTFRKNEFQPTLIRIDQVGRLDRFVEVATPVAVRSSKLESDILDFLEHTKAPEDLSLKFSELKVRATRISMMANVLKRFCDFGSWADDVHWFNTEPDRQGSTVQVCITPLSIAPLLVESIFSKLQTVVCTSATLDLQDDFAFWSSRVGLPFDQNRPFLKGTFGSPFDYKNRLLLLTPSDAPLPGKDLDDGYVDYMARTIWSAVNSAGGGALVLFTSYVMLKRVKEQVQKNFEEESLALLCQGDLDRYTLLRRFIEEQNSTLFATSSFWEGVDAPGNTLRLVIIVKLPFTVPSDPVFKARCDALDASGGSGFYQLALQSATMKLKQGFGRLLRSTGDKGVVLVLDSRVIQRSYGQYMLRSLPESYHPETTSATVCDKIENFLFG